jgi:hypothetical protein
MNANEKRCARVACRTQGKGWDEENGGGKRRPEENRENERFLEKKLCGVQLEGNSKKIRGTVVLRRKRFTSWNYRYPERFFSWLLSRLSGML